MFCSISLLHFSTRFFTEFYLHDHQFQFLAFKKIRMRTILQRLCSLRILKDKTFSITWSISTPSLDMKIRYTTIESYEFAIQKCNRLATTGRESTIIKDYKYNQGKPNRLRFHKFHTRRGGHAITSPCQYGEGIQSGKVENERKEGVKKQKRKLFEWSWFRQHKEE